MRFAQNTKDDNAYIPIVMMLKHHGFQVFQYEKLAKQVRGEPEPWGTGYQTRALKYRRVIYTHKKLVYKFWGKDYLWADNILLGIRNEFYGMELTEALIGVIIDDDVDVRGYVMHRVANLQGQHQHDQMMRKLKRKTRKTGMCFPDCIKQNVGVWKDRVTLLDLENVVAAGKGVITKDQSYDKVVRGCS